MKIFFFFSLLKGAQEVRLRKRLIADLGEELQEFCIEDCENFEGVFDQEKFFTSSERQTIVRYYLMSLRAMAGDAWDDHTQFSHGQAISKLKTVFDNLVVFVGRQNNFISLNHVIATERARSLIFLLKCGAINPF